MLERSGHQNYEMEPLLLLLTIISKQHHNLSITLPLDIDSLASDVALELKAFA